MSTVNSQHHNIIELHHLSLSDVVVVILQRILCVAHCLCQLQGRSGGKNVNDVILSHIYILHSPSQATSNTK